MGLMRDRKLEDEYAKIFDDLGFDIDAMEKEDKEIQKQQEEKQKIEQKKTQSESKQGEK